MQNLCYDGTSLYFTCTLVLGPGLCNVWIRLVVSGDVCFDSGGVLENQCVYGLLATCDKPTQVYTENYRATETHR